MKELEAKLLEITEQEERLVFDKFDSDDAWNIGTKLLDRARREKQQLIIRISLNHRIIFEYAMNGTAPNNTNWVRRKENTVYCFYKSSFYLENQMELIQMNIRERYHLNEEDYATKGGGFPINIKGIGTVGAIIVSGMESHEDHRYIVEAIEEYLN